VFEPDVGTGLLPVHCRLPLTVLPEQFCGVVPPISIGLRLFFTVRLPLTVAPHTLPSWVPGTFWITRLPSINTPGPRAKALAPEIAVNAVAPGMIDLGDKFAAAFMRKMAKQTPMRRNGRGEEIGAAVLFFATAPQFVTGQILAVDGGLGL